MNTGRRRRAGAFCERYFTRNSRGRGGRGTSRTPIPGSDWPGPAATALCSLDFPAPPR